VYIPDFNLCHANSSWPGFHTCLLSLSFIDYLRCRNNWRFFKNTVIKQVLCIFTTLQLLQWRWKQSFASLCRKLCRSFIFFSDGRWCGDVVLSCLQVWFPEFHPFPPTLSLVHRWIGRCLHPCSATPPTTRGGALAMHTGNANFCWMGGDAPACNFSNNIFRGSHFWFLVLGKCLNLCNPLS